MPANGELLRQREQSVLFYEERFSNGYMEEWPIEKKQRLIALFRELPLPEHGRGLDFGCGNGVLTAVLAEALPKWTIEGTDVSETALRHASARYPQCRFFLSREDDVDVEPYELVFTHHVLEHVYDLDRAWNELIRLLKPQGGMVHILPCGNAGSFEFQLCSLRKGGIDKRQANRFFFEDEGHLRRLSTEDLQPRARHDGFVLRNEYYANQWYGAIDWIIQRPLQFIRDISDTSFALDRSAKWRLAMLRSILLVFKNARFRIAEYDGIRTKHPKRLKQYAYLIVAAPAYLIARGIDYYLKWNVRREWITQRDRREGSEMYMYFARE
jgi:SAM-dependent methyltransferase